MLYYTYYYRVSYKRQGCRCKKCWDVQLSLINSLIVSTLLSACTCTQQHDWRPLGMNVFLSLFIFLFLFLFLSLFLFLLSLYCFYNCVFIVGLRRIVVVFLTYLSILMIKDYRRNCGVSQSLFCIIIYAQFISRTSA